MDKVKEIAKIRALNLIDHASVLAAYLAVEGIDSSRSWSVGTATVALVSNTLGDILGQSLTNSDVVGSNEQSSALGRELSKVFSATFQTALQPLISYRKMSWKSFYEALVTSLVAALISTGAMTGLAATPYYNTVKPYIVA